MRLSQIEQMLEDHEKRIKALEEARDRSMTEASPEKTGQEPIEDEIDMTNPEKPISSLKILEPSRKTEKKLDYVAEQMKERNNAPQDTIVSETSPASNRGRTAETTPTPDKVESKTKGSTEKTKEEAQQDEPVKTAVGKEIRRETSEIDEKMRKENE